MRTLPEQLQHLAETIERPREEDGTPATLQALLPCEPAIGAVAVACWTDSDGGELFELVRLEGGERVSDDVALREALTLLSMVETLEERAAFEQADQLSRELAAWEPPDGELEPAFARARADAIRTLAELAALAPGEEPRLARPQLLDSVGGALRSLERAWERLEQGAEIWSDALLARHRGDDAAVAQVQELWQLLAGARRGPLAQPASAVLHDGREAGAALAAAVLAAQG